MRRKFHGVVGSIAFAVLAPLGVAEEAVAQALPNPYRIVEGWAKDPEGRPMGRLGGVTVDLDGRHIWAVVRCEAEATFGTECLDSDLDSVLKFDPEGNVVAGLGGGLFIWPHGIDVDPEGNVWVTDAVSAAATPPGTRAHQVIKFSPEGEVLMRLGTPGVMGDDTSHFNAPSDVVVAKNGDVFVADGHNDDGNNRVVKFTKDGEFIKAWGRTGYAPGEFRTLHAITIDSRGRVFVGDRSNNRIQIFDQEGAHLSTWTQFGSPSGLFFDEQDRIYVADSTSDNIKNPGWEYGIRIGDAAKGWVSAFILYPSGDPRVARGFGAESVTVDREGNIYAGEVYPRKLQKYVRVRP